MSFIYVGLSCSGRSQPYMYMRENLSDTIECKRLNQRILEKFIVQSRVLTQKASRAIKLPVQRMVLPRSENVVTVFRRSADTRQPVAVVEASRDG